MRREGRSGMDSGWKDEVEEECMKRQFPDDDNERT